MNQRDAALKSANSRRIKQRSILREVEAGTTTAADILRDPPAEMSTVRVGELLGAQRRWGRIRVGEFLLCRLIPESRLLGEMPAEIRTCLADDVEGRPKRESELRRERCVRGHVISEVGRTKSRNCRACHRENERKRSRQIYKDERVDARPFAAWLESHIPTEGKTEWARSRGMDESQMRRIVRGEQVTVSLTIVDRALLDTPTGLWELYPDFYAEELEEAA